MSGSNPYETPTAEHTGLATKTGDTSIVQNGFLGMGTVGVLGAVWVGINSENVVLAPLLISVFVLSVGATWFGLLAWLCKSTSNKFKLFAAGLAGSLTGLTVSSTAIYMDFPNGVPRFALVAMIGTCAVITGSMGAGSFFGALIRYLQVYRRETSRIPGTRLTSENNE